MVFCLVKLKKKTILVASVGRLIMMVTSFGIALFTPFVELGNSPEFHPFDEQGSHELASLSSLAWLASRVLLLELSGTPWAIASSDLASSLP